MDKTPGISCRRETSVMSLKSVNRGISHQRTSPIMYIVDDRDHRKGNHLLLEGGKRETEDRIFPRSVDADDSDVELNNDDESDGDDDEDDEDDGEALMAELERIRKEKAEEKLCQEKLEQEEQLKAKEAEEFHLL
ncbi:spliceosome-associated protein CWC15 homolog [Hibiscus syriacus]|uniref:spliceosome-associated protein CWC15 homolog n=1 Tax=Hibiscus syriacus TaxID=106335 RepID=UPI001922784C|nr:spliceosome-associated protein CWC15 homolog [Hibiscus syriacus]